MGGRYYEKHIRDRKKTNRSDLSNGHIYQIIILSRYKQPIYSPYNLYLVYLAIQDLIFSLTFLFGVCVRMIHQQPVIHNLIGTIVLC